MANKINDQPLRIKRLTDSDFLLLTVNHQLIGRSDSHRHYNKVMKELEENKDNLTRRKAYQSQLFQNLWKLYYKQVFPNLLPFKRLKDTKRQANLRVGDVCFLRYEEKVEDTYRLCRVSKLQHDQHRVLRTVEIEKRP